MRYLTTGFLPLFVFWVAVNTTPPAWAEENKTTAGAAEKERRLEFYAETGYQTFNFQLPEKLEFTPAHRHDFNPGPSGGYQAPLSPATVNTVGFGLNMHLRCLPKLSLGVKVTVPLFSHDWQTGKFVTRRPYPLFNPTGIASPLVPLGYAYTRISELSPRGEFRVARDWLSLENKKPALKTGFKYARQYLKIEQGWDRFQRREVFQETGGSGGLWGGFVDFSLPLSDDGLWRFKAGLEYDRGTINYGSFGRKPAHTVAYHYFGLEKRF